ncbi:MAG: hypothetical protein QW103_01905 [Candidatus Pacearchaeota archaeon]
MDGKIIFLDNEFENVSDLIEIIEDACTKQKTLSSERIFYFERINETIEYLLEMKNNKDKIDVFICDNHLSDLVDGDDFIRFLRGEIVYLLSGEHGYINVNIKKIRRLEDIERMLKGKIIRKEFINLIKENFNNFEEYKSLVNYLDNEGRPITTILFCGYPLGVNLKGIEDIQIIRKRDGCEYELLEYLEINNVFSKEDYNNSLLKHYRLSPYSDKKYYNPKSKHIIKKKLKKL